MHKYTLRTALNDFFDVTFLNFGFTIDNHFIAFNRYHFTGILIHEILSPTLQNPCGKFTTYTGLKILLIDFYFLSQIKDFQNIPVIFEANSSQKSSNWQFFLTVDISIHHVVDIRSKFYPRTFKRNDTCRIQQSTICVHTLSEEYTWRPMKLRNHYALSTVDYESTIMGHIRYRTQKYILNHGIKVFMIRVSAIQFQFSLKRYTIRQTAFQTFIYSITRRIDIVIQELKNEIITSIGYREVLSEHLI